VVGIAMACAIMMTGASFSDAADHLIFVQFKLLQREDMAVTFTDPTSRESLSELAALPGVTRVEGVRSVPARLRFGHKSHRTSITGMPEDQELRRLLDVNYAPVPLPPSGVVITEFLGKMLGIRPGDTLTVEVLEGSRPVKEVPVLGLVQEYLGVAAYMDLDALNALMGQGNAVSGAYLAADERYLDEIYDRLNDRPRVAGTVLQKQAVIAYMDSMDRQVLVFAFFNTLLAAAIAFGVVYNSARIALAERGRELASLRVLGYTRGEISYILLGELGVQTLLAIPVGFYIGRGLCAFIYKGFENELFRIPLVIETSTYALAAAVVLVSALISAAVIRVKLNRLDLIEVLKTRE
jgi:putative ABC transport system permease protein